MTQKENTKKTEKAGENMVFVGKKNTTAYVLAVMTQFANGADVVSVKARGRAISKAVDVAEIVRNRGEIKADLESIGIATEEVETEDGRPLKVSTIEIKVKKTN